MDASEFQTWAKGIAERFGYTVNFYRLGLSMSRGVADADGGFCDPGARRNELTVSRDAKALRSGALAPSTIAIF